MRYNWNANIQCMAEKKKKIREKNRINYVKCVNLLVS